MCCKLCELIPFLSHLSCRSCEGRNIRYRTCSNMVSPASIYHMLVRLVRGICHSYYGSFSIRMCTMMRGAARLFPRLFLQPCGLPYGKSAPFACAINEQKKETVPLMSSPLCNWPPLFARGLFQGARGLLSLSRYFNQRTMCFCTIEVVSSGFIVDQPWFPSKRVGKLPSIIFITIQSRRWTLC